MNIFNLFLIGPLANGLILFYKILGANMGLAIIGFSIFLRFVLNPLTKPYMNSMKKMKDVAPDLEKLKKRHSGDKIKLAQAQADLYRQKGVNPGAGCLPYLLQIVVLIAFFNVFVKTLSPDGDPTMRFNELLYSPLKFSQNEVINTRFLYLDVTRPDILKLPFISFPIPGPILILSALVQFLSAKVMSPYTKLEEKIAKKTKGSGDDFQVAMQKSMVYTFPLFTLFIGMRFASGLALYWFIFSLTQIMQQVRSQGWGELTPWLEKLKGIKS
ncbi:MAG: Membrane protein insertase, YidC/Oxa1 family [Candidatus Woesebacteria bacterium GW2011_GWB1_39_12]|uniref:Membrane protein insertase, YidC/Oxa1 family n=2 Tax=Candidatus Woeseibacteriota TaxID=1752722 RepID=A0A0G0MC98_9BACT|nr:MAG: Membrane protein insertase, YidC/Oxa1 family [Candidatus Woesebacteria bacterium GW2011_GWA1_39_12]KKR00087.1 MAG: Membrane protein insertase, YidC/Oxa1 family [Candidatus Woesebacteria bacterium GW2011_GWB1_39_12]